MTTHLSFLKPRRTNPHAPLFVYLPGMDSTGELLRTQMGSLESRFDVRCLAIPAHNLQGWKTLSEQVIELIERELQLSQKRLVYLCGESFGGCLAMKVILNAPNLVDRLILSNPASSFRSHFLYHSVIPLMNFVPSWWHQGTAALLMPFLAEWERVEKHDRLALLTAMQSVPPKTVGRRLSLLKNFQLNEEKLRRFTQPVLLLAGAADRLLPSVKEAQTLAQKFPNANVAILPRSGHACLLEREIKLYELLESHCFLPGRAGDRPGQLGRSVGQ